MKSTARLALCVLAILFPIEIEVRLFDVLIVELVSGTGHAKSENSGKGNSNDDDDDDDDYNGDEGRNEQNSRDEDAQPGLLRVEKINGGVRLVYSDGSREVIRNGKYERKNSKGRVVERRRARGSDIARVRSKVGRVDFLDRADSTQATARAVMITGTGRNIDVLFSNGWRERITAGRYILTDQFGRAVVKRTATDDDQARLHNYRK